MTYFVIALALVLGFTQCKKEQPIAQNDSVRITLTVDNGTSSSTTGNGSKVIVDPTGHTNPDYATVTFENGDVIYVGNNGTYCGYLEYNKPNEQTPGCFSGTINPTSEADYLHFYFMGNKGEKSEPTSVSITDQTSKYPVISYAHSTVLFNSDITSCSAKLQNYCAIVKFNTTSIARVRDITITGMKNTVTVNFAANNAATSVSGEPYTFSMSGEGDITLHAETKAERWAILLPQDEVTTATATAFGYVTPENFTVPEITSNSYLNEGVPVNLEYTLPQGAINGSAITINANGDQVYFSMGNLQYQASTNTWRFATAQWTYIGGNDIYGNPTSGNPRIGNNSLASETYNGWIDLFGWGTSGWDNGNLFYHPWDCVGLQQEYSEIGMGYGPTDGTNYTYDLTGVYANADWGVYNAISNGGNQKGVWRTLTNDEWDYIINTRTTASGIRYVKATVCDVNGVILLPDNWNSSNYTLNTNTTNVDFNINTIDLTTWNNYFRYNGAVFLPAAGNRSGTDVGMTGISGYYYSSTCWYHPKAYSLLLNKAYVKMYKDSRFRGCSVRLVCSVD